MIDEQKRQIRLLREHGMSFSKISAYTGAAMSSVHYQCRDVKVDEDAVDEQLLEKIENREVCAYCGGKLQPSAAGRPKRFCCDDCRKAYWKMHRNEAKKNTKYIYTKVCPYCGRTFEAYAKRNRKYCCHEHYVLDRFGSRKRLNDTENR